VYRENPIMIGLDPRKNRGRWRQALFARKLLAGFPFEVNLVKTLLGLLAVPPNAVEVVFFLVLLLRDPGSKMVVGVGA